MIDTFMITTEWREQADYFRTMTFTSLLNCGHQPKFISNQKPFECYLTAEKEAKTDIYLVCDDDVVIGAKGMIETAFQVMQEHPEIGLLGFVYRKGVHPSQYGSWLKNQLTDDIYEIDHTGGVLMLRKGAVRDYGERPDHSVGIAHDRTLASAVRQSGFKVCIDFSLHYNHIGEGYSTKI